ncbi:hypothetical protein [Halomicrobium salinisoli]|uniref:hypothetical protein n=1 Tax=Halomicrobium salinisoli TaxID=2878391 RepID=UPI001CF09052|nr:hypothetical protein [Halomicrobium salinisoli]
MSSDARTGSRADEAGVRRDSPADGDGAPTRSCSFCGTGTSAPLALQWYGRPDVDRPVGVPDHGGLDLCRDCADEVVELLSTWTALGAPPVDADASIADGYRRIADACSFCEDPLDGDAAGVEWYGTDGDADAAPQYANYALCEGCRVVTGQFLQSVREDCR